MEEIRQDIATYNLWSAPWIGLERPHGGIDRVGINEALCRARDYLSIYDPSPLVVVGIYRLLIAILQAALRPGSNRDLERLWRDGRFPEEAIAAFGRQYAERFDLFSPNAPFLQSGDLAVKPLKGDPVKSAAYLMPEIPAGTEVTHYRHGAEDNLRFCPACAAAGLVTIPAFATSGGRGLKPSINGVPPMYIIPGGTNLFESLAAGLMQPEFFPAHAQETKDTPFWERNGVVPRSIEVSEVGYLHSLTFLARRVRLHPEHQLDTCSRCGKAAQWVVRTMIFEMGESRPKGLLAWQDPFAAYKAPENDKDNPTPIRPIVGKATWREFCGLFLQVSTEPGKKGKRRSTVRPRVLDQISDLFTDDPEDGGPAMSTRSFRCVGMRTDMKAKVFEWIDSGFDVPMRLLLAEETAGKEVDEAILLAGDCIGILNSAFRESFNDKLRKSDRYKQNRQAMTNAYWTRLSEPFRQFILLLDPLSPLPARRIWAETVLGTARAVFHEALEALPDNAATLRKRVIAEKECSYELGKRRKKENLDE